MSLSPGNYGWSLLCKKWTGDTEQGVRTIHTPMFIWPGDDAYLGGGVAAVGVPGAIRAGQTMSATYKQFL